jgi:transcriptional regulator with XRE-family HTH domain
MPTPRKKRFDRPLGKHHIREWRTYRGYTLYQLAEMVGTTHGHLSAIERRIKPYNQELLELLAEALMTDAASLIMRNPTEPEAIWTIWEQAKPAQKAQIVDLASVVVKQRRTVG